MNSRTVLAWIGHWHTAGAFADCSSEQVLERYVSTRDEAAFRELMHRHGGHVWVICRLELPCNGLAEDAFQATFFALIRTAGRIREAGALSAWLDKTARREVKAIRRKRTHHKRVEAAKGATVENGGGGVPHDSAKVLREAVDELPERYRLPIVYRYLSGLSPAEMARAVGIPEDTGKTRLKRGLELLRKKLTGRELGLGVGAVSMEAALRAAVEPVPVGLFSATVKAVQALPVKRGILAAVLGVATYRRVVVGGFTLAGGMAVALAILPAPQPRLVKVSLNTTPERDPSMRGSPLLAIVAALGLAPKAPAQTFTKIADTSTPIPNGSGTFGLLDSQSAISGSSIAFQGSRSTFKGIYTAPVNGGPINRFIDYSMQVPNDPALFGFLGRMDYSNNMIVFSGGPIDNNGLVVRGGLYSGPVGGGPTTVIANYLTPVPGGTGMFNGIAAEVKVSGSTVAFASGSGGIGAQWGVYTAPITGGTITRVADLNSPLPGGGGNFALFGNVSISGSTVGFRGTGAGNYQGVFTAPVSGGQISVVADTSMPIPNGTGTFTVVGSHAFSGSVMVFRATGNNGQSGLYSRSISGGPVIRIADTNTSVPGGTGNFTNFPGPETMAISGNTVAFYAFFDNNQKQGIYLAAPDGTGLRKVIDMNDVLDGRTISKLGFYGGTQLDGSTLSFSAQFTDNTSAVYTFTPVPEPAAVLALSAAAAAGCFALGRWLFSGL